MKKRNNNDQYYNSDILPPGDNFTPVRLISYAFKEWRPMPNNLVYVKGVADGENFDGVLFIRSNS